MNEQILSILEKWVRRGRLKLTQIKKPMYQAEIEKRMQPKKVK